MLGLIAQSYEKLGDRAQAGVDRKVLALPVHNTIRHSRVLRRGHFCAEPLVGFVEHRLTLSGKRQTALPSASAAATAAKIARASQRISALPMLKTQREMTPNSQLPTSNSQISLPLDREAFGSWQLEVGR